MQNQITPEALLATLKHPLCCGDMERGEHLRQTRNFELGFLRGGPPFITAQHVAEWAEKSKDVAQKSWTEWLQAGFAINEQPETLSALVDVHVQLANHFSGTAGNVWDKESGAAAQHILAKLAEETASAGPLSMSDYATLFLDTLRREEIRKPDNAHPRVFVWGTLEARTEQADVTILAGLNEGVWPAFPGADPWLSRGLRKELGLLLPERRIGLSAHDFQQASVRGELVLSRTKRLGEEPAVPSRWLLRLTNLLAGLGPAGRNAIKDMQARGADWCALADALTQPETPIKPAERPAPKPPAAARPDRLSVTQIKTLVRDPYAIYAKKVLGLTPLDPLGREPDALTRGIALHDMLEAFIAQTRDALPPGKATLFLDIAADVLAREAPWPAARQFWMARIARVAPLFLRSEEMRRKEGQVLALETKGALPLPDVNFTLTGKADRLDRNAAGELLIYDYKGGKPPTEPDRKRGDRQLELEALIARSAGFEDLSDTEIAALEYIGFDAEHTAGKIAVSQQSLDDAWAELQELIAYYMHSDNGFTARDKPEALAYDGEYDQLSRFGEWRDSDDPVAEILT
jgi:double-strand break repair protein AddB